MFINFYIVGEVLEREGKRERDEERERRGYQIVIYIYVLAAYVHNTASEND